MRSSGGEPGDQVHVAGAAGQGVVSNVVQDHARRFIVSSHGSVLLVTLIGLGLRLRHPQDLLDGGHAGGHLVEARPRAGVVMPLLRGSSGAGPSAAGWPVIMSRRSSSRSSSS